jgi:iron complex outermembrane receptor protein
VDLSAQKAWQLEIGTRGRSGGLQWDLSAYDLEIEDEIININVQPFPNAPFTVPTYRNAPKTRHLGIETALGYELPTSIFEPRDRMSARVAYTWGHFAYVRDTTYAGNRLPGTPEHYVQAEVEYSHPSGLSFRPSVEWVPGSYFVDSANQISKDGWTTIGARVDWALPQLGGSVFVEGRNLTNAHYAPAVAVDDAAGRFFFPADGRSFYAGFRWQPGS